MKSELRDFISLVRNKGLLTSTHFFVNIPNLGDNGRDLMMLCDQTSIPGMSLMTTETRVYGEITETPHSILYAPVSLSFYLDRDLIAKKALDRWMNSVFDRNKRTIGFYSDYTRDVDIFVTDKNGNVVYCHKLREAYPKYIGDIQLSYTGDTVLKVDVTLVYKWSERQEVTHTGESIVSSSGNLSKTDPYNDRQYEKTINYGAQSARDSFSNLRNDSDNRFEGMGESLVDSGAGAFSRLNPANGFSISGNLDVDLYNYGDMMRENFSRAANVNVAALSASSLDASLSNQLILGSKAISRDMGNYSKAISSLGQSLSDVAKPISGITTSMFSLGQSLSIVNNTLGSHGIGTPFSGAISDINRYAGSLAQVSTLAGIPGQLSGFGSALSATGGLFNEAVTQMRNLPGYTNNVESAIRNMSETFIRGGTNTQNIASEISSRVQSGNQ